MGEERTAHAQIAMSGPGRRRQELRWTPKLSSTRTPAHAQAHFLGRKVRRKTGGRAGAVARQGPKMSHAKYKPSRLATLPPTLDPAEYDISPETRKAQAERLAIRSRLKREYLLQYNDPSRHGLIVSGVAGRESRAGVGTLGSGGGSPDPPGGPQRGGRRSGSVC